jgi:hypothetical protein
MRDASGVLWRNGHGRVVDASAGVAACSGLQAIVASGRRLGGHEERPVKTHAVHQQPVWRERANFIVDADVGEPDQPPRFEQLWARQVAADHFVLCCIPYFAYGLSLEDEVLAATSGEDRYVVRDVVRRSGRWVFRVWFGESHAMAAADRLLRSIHDLGCLHEWSSGHLVAIDAANDAQKSQLAPILVAGHQNREWTFEVGSDGRGGSGALEP